MADRQDRQDKRSQIMQAAEKLFTSRRFHEITLDDVIHEAGVGKGTVYRYFQDKDDLFFQTVMAGFDELCELVQSAAVENKSFPDNLLGICVQISGFFQKRRQLLRMMQSEEARLHWCTGEVRDRWLAHRRRLVAAVAAVLRQGATEGGVRQDIPTDILAAFLLGMLRTRARDFVAPDSQPDLATVVDLFLRGAGGAGRDRSAGLDNGEKRHA